MKRIVASAVLVALLSIVPAALCLTYGLYEREMARAGEALSVFDFDVAAAIAENVDRSLGYVDVVPWVGGTLRAGAQRRVVEARDWQGAYSALVGTAERLTRDDPEIRFLVANAYFRMASAEPDRRVALESIDAAILGYRQTIEADPGNLRAAYNYEYGLRVRKGLRVAHALASTSVHGVEGVLPVPAGMEKVNVLIPLQAGEGPKKGGTEAGKTGVTRKRG